MGINKIDVLARIKGTWIGTIYRRSVWNKRILSEKVISKTIDQCEPEISAARKKELISDILSMARKYRFSPEEYFCYHFEDKTEEERKSFLSDLNRIDFCEKLNKTKNLAIFDDKLLTYKTFKKYFKRDICGVTSKKDKNKFKEFVQKHNRFIVKPLSSSCGAGIQIVDLSSEANIDDVICNLLSQYCKGFKPGFIAEELIVQVEEMAKFHPQSLNTIRIATVRFDEGVEILGTFFRMGRGDSIVDNAGAGGIFGTISPQNGKVIVVGDEFGNIYEVHPDSKLEMIGFEIPMWEDAVTLAKELATVVKGNRYAGWDLAFTEKGWVLVEANARGQFVWQIPTQKGCLEEVNRILSRLGHNSLKLSI